MTPRDPGPGKDLILRYYFPLRRWYFTMSLNRSGSYRKCKRSRFFPPHFSQILALICEWLSSVDKSWRTRVRVLRPDNVPFFSLFSFFFFSSLSLHFFFFFYFGDQPWHPHRRLIFNYGAADSRTRNTFIAAPGIDFPHGSTEIYPHRIVHLSFQEQDSFSPREFVRPNISKLLFDFVKIIVIFNLI